MTHRQRRAKCHPPSTAAISPAIDWTKPHCKNHFDPFNPACSRLHPNSHDTDLFVYPSWICYISKNREIRIDATTVFRLELDEPPGHSLLEPGQGIRYDRRRAIAHRITGSRFRVHSSFKRACSRPSAAFNRWMIPALLAAMIAAPCFAQDESRPKPSVTPSTAAAAAESPPKIEESSSFRNCERFRCRTIATYSTCSS